MGEWTPEVVRARYTEAMDVLRRMPNVGISRRVGFWPEYMHDTADMNGWGSTRLAEEREMRARRRHATSLELSRKEEVDRWTADLIKDDLDRLIVVHWAECRAQGESFRDRCERFGWVPVSAYRRLQRAIRAICRRLNRSDTLLRLPAPKWLLQETAKTATNSSGSSFDDIEPIRRSPTSMIEPGAKPTHTLTTTSAVDRFEKFLKRTNAKRRRKRERRLAELAKSLMPATERAA